MACYPLPLVARPVSTSLPDSSHYESGEYKHGDILPAADLAHEYSVSVRVTYSALAMLAANRYVSRCGAFTSYRIIWQAGT